jgi:sialate O-acetylesterase
MRFSPSLPLLLTGLGALLSNAGHADVKLPAVFASQMVLQRDVPVPVWGTADAGEEVQVQWDGKPAGKSVADADGKWKITLGALQVGGGAHTLTVAGKNTVKLEDILVGEVWLGSGQSNMEWSLASTLNAPAVIAAANHPEIRLFHVPKVQTPKPADDVKARWAACASDSVKGFSGVLYYFGTKLQEELKVPVGLINSSWGGSPIEPWTIHEGVSGGMYNGMIAPLVPFPVRGILWYQGETNVLRKNGFEYLSKMENLIGGWRTAWGAPNMPFHFVQIAPWKGKYEEEELPKLWEAQVASLKIPNTGMAVTTDLVDNITDIHPKNKKDVGHRLARWALAKDYNRSGIVYSGPLFKEQKIEGNKIRIRFAHTASGLKSRDEKPLSDFEIAGADGAYVPATAVIDGKDVVVSAEGVNAPKNVRFAWSNTAQPNLANSEDLPASPFRSENWRGGTGE